MPLTLILLVATASFTALGAKATEDAYSEKFEWSDGIYNWSYNISIPKAVYDQYKAVPAADRIGNEASDYGYVTTTNDPYLAGMAEEFKEKAAEQGYSSFDTAKLVLAFVQSLPNNINSATASPDSYRRFPLETIVDGGGDCEDTSVLYAAIMCRMNYSVILIQPSQHLAVGIRGSDDVEGGYFTFEGSRFYYCETNVVGYTIGQIPPDMKEHQKATLMAIDLTAQFSPAEQPEPSAPWRQPSPDWTILGLVSVISAVSVVCITVGWLVTKGRGETSTGVQ